MASLFEILVNIAANTASFESGMQRANNRIEAFANIAKNAFELTGATLSLGALGDAFESAASRGEQLTQLSGRMGATVASLSQLQYAAAATNVPFQSLTSAIDIMSRNLVQTSEGTGKAQAAFRDLGIDAAALAAVPLGQQLDIIANKIAALPTPTEQTAAAMRVFGSSGAELLPFLSQGAAGIDALRQRSDDLGATLDALSAKHLSAAKQSMDDLKISSAALWTEIAADSAPALSAVAGHLTNIIGGFKDLTFGFSTQEAELASMVRQATDLSNQIDKLAPKVAGEGFFHKFFDLDASQMETDIQLLSELQKKIAELEKRPASSTPSKSLYDPNALQPVAVTAGYLDHTIDLRKVEEVAVTAQKIQTDSMQRYYDSLDTMSQTDTERTVAAWQEKTNAAHNYTQHVLESIDPSDIGAVVDAVAEQADRMTDINNQFLQPVAVTAKYIGGLAKQQYDEMANYAQTAAKSVQSDFATFLEHPSVSSFKAMGEAWLQTLDKMVADAAAAQLFNTLFPTATGTSGLGGIFGTFLSSLFGGGSGAVDSAALSASASAGVDTAFNGLLGFANGGSFNVGGFGGTDSQLVAFKATPGENVQVGGGGSNSPIIVQNYVTVTSPQVTKTDVLAAMQQTQASTVAKLQDMKRRSKF